MIADGLEPVSSSNLATKHLSDSQDLISNAVLSFTQPIGKQFRVSQDIVGSTRAEKAPLLRDSSVIFCLSGRRIFGDSR